MHENEKLSKIPGSNSSDTLLSRRDDRKDEDKKTFKCQYYKEPGHYVTKRSYSYKKNVDLKEKEQHSRNVRNDPEDNEKSEVVLKSTNPVSKDVNWWIDTVASPQPMTPDEKVITNNSSFEYPLQVNLPDAVYSITTEKGIFICLISC